MNKGRQLIIKVSCEDLIPVKSSVNRNDKVRSPSNKPATSVGESEN